MAANLVAPRPYQVVVWGASGFTGRLVCEHIARDYQGKIRWAMAGRDARKLEQVRSDLSKINPACKDVPILTADAHDSPAVHAVVRQGQVVLSTAGPFARHGDAVVAQAVEAGTHYADITGEVTWVKRSVAAHDAAAAAKGVRVLHCCGYDSVPSDLGAMMMADFCREQLGCGVDRVITLIGDSRGGFSGGTLESGVNLLVNEPPAEVRAANADPYYLASMHGLSRGTDVPAGLLPRWLPAAGKWGAPWVMEGVNAKIVHASNALAAKISGSPYGRDFKYTEMIGAGLAGAAIMTGLTAAMGAVFMLPPLRAVARRFLPAPGEGPSEAARKAGYWNHELIAVTDEATPRTVRGKCGDSRDPGYWSTSRMLLETGLCLALEAERLDADPRVAKGGVLTPATGCGKALLGRLRGAGFTFEVTGVDGEEKKASVKGQEAAVPAGAR